VTLQGLGWVELGKLFAIFGGVMVALYILRLRRRRVAVPFSPLWSRVVVDKQASSLFSALRRVGSLLVQLAVIALVVLALGDPKVGSLAGCVHEDEKPPPPRHALLVIDASASMATVEGGRTRLELAKKKAHELVDRLAVHPSQRVMVVQLDVATEPLSLWTSDAATLHAAVDAVAPDGARDTPTAVQELMSLARDALRDRSGAETLLVSDFAFDAPPKAELEAIHLHAFPIGGAADNIGIESFNVRPYLDDRLAYVAFYALRNEAARPVPASLFIYANPKGSSEADFAAPQRLIHTERVVLPANDTLRGHIQELKFAGSRVFARLVVDSADPMRDAFPRDDVAFAVVPERKTLNVQLVSDGNLFLNAALFLRENVKLTTVTPADYRGPAGYDVTVVDGAEVDLEQPGNYVLFAPPPSKSLVVKGVLSAPEITKVDKKHPLSRHVGFADVNALEALVYAPEKKDEVVVSAQGGVPLVFARTVPDPKGARRYVVVAFDLRKSLFPMSYGFPIFVVNALSSFSAEAEGLVQPNRAGVPLALELVAQAQDGPASGTQEAGAIAVRGPDLDAAAAAAAGIAARRVGDRVHVTLPRLGIWELGNGPSAVPVAVNLLSPDESRIVPRPPELAAWAAPVFEPPKENLWLRDFWRVLLLVALAVVVVEWATWHRRVTV
jgi:hypothetical protein